MNKAYRPLITPFFSRTEETLRLVQVDFSEDGEPVSKTILAKRLTGHRSTSEIGWQTAVHPDYDDWDYKQPLPDNYTMVEERE